MNTETLHVECGDSRALLAELPDASVDSVVCDPPYFLNFMGRDWDKLDGNAAACPEFWRDVLRVLKPGGHLLAFGAPRTYHRLAVAVEDAGFEIRDSLHWCFGTGFPKSLNVGKAIDKRRDDTADIYTVTAWVRAARDAAGLTNRDIDNAFGRNGMARHWTDVLPTGHQPAVPTPKQLPKLMALLGDPAIPELVAGLLATLNERKGEPGDDWYQREIVGVAGRSGPASIAYGRASGSEYMATAPATDAAKQWDGWGTALKPSHEPILLARKPLTGTVAQNVVEHGAGAINVDACRVATATPRPVLAPTGRRPTGVYGSGTLHGSRSIGTTTQGRWPPNLLLTHAPTCTETECADGCPVAEMGRQSGTRKSAGNKKPTTGQGAMFGSTGKRAWDVSEVSKGDTGTAARYFPCFRYQAKAPRKERDAGLAERNGHPCVKPIELMRWLCRLVTPPGGLVLDPFAGSGSTGCAAAIEGFRFLGFELDEGHAEIARARIEHHRKASEQCPDQD